MGIEAEKDEQEREETPPRRRRWLLIAAGLLGLLVVALVVLLFIPIRHERLDALLSERFGEATGLGLEFDQATLRLGRARLDVERPVLTDPETGERLLEAEAVRVDSSLPRLIFGGRPYVMQAIELVGPFHIDVTLREGRPELMEPWPRIIEIIQANQDEERGERSVALEMLRISPVRLRWLEPDDTGTTHTVASIHDMAIEVDFEGQPRPRRVEATGDWRGDGRRDFQLQAELDLEQGQQRGQWTMRIGALDTGRLMPGLLPAEIQARPARLEGRLRRDGLNWHTEGRLLLDNTRIYDDQDATLHEVDRIDLRWVATLDQEARLAKIERLTMSSPNADMLMHGQMEIEAPFPYSASLERFELRDEGLAAMGDWLLPHGVAARPGEGVATLTGSVAGDQLTTHPTSLQATYTMEGVAWKIPELAGPIRDISARVSLTTDTLTLEDLNGVIAGLPVRLEGTATGDLLAGHVGQVELDWHTAGDLGELETPSGQTTEQALEGLQLTGDIVGSGTLRLSDPLVMEQAMERVRAEGRLRLRRAEVEHPALPEPLTDLRGELEFTSREARLHVPSARLGGTSLTLEAHVLGGPELWTSQTLTATARAAGPVPVLVEHARRIAQRLDPEGELELDLPPIEGDAVLTLGTEQMRLDRWRQEPLQLKLDVRDFATRLELEQAEQVQGPIQLGAERLRLEGRISIESMERATDEGSPPDDLELTLRVENGNVDHQRLPAPVSELSGTAIWSGRTLMLDQVRGRTLEGEFLVDGGIEGRRLPWQEPLLDLNLQLETSLANALEQARERELFELPEQVEYARGQALIETRLRGRPEQWRAGDQEIRVVINDLETSFSVQRVGGPLTSPRVELLFDQESLRLAPTSGRFGELDFMTSGTLRPGGGEVAIQLAGALREMQRRVPHGLERFRVGGLASIDHRHQLRPREGFIPPQTWPGMIDYLTAVLEQEAPGEQLKAEWVDDYSGRLRLDNAELTLLRMPTPLRGLTGLALYEKGRLWTPQPIGVAPGTGSVNVRSTFDILWDRPDGQPPTIAFDVSGDHFSIDEWIDRWRGPGDPPPAEWPDDLKFNPALTPSLSVRGMFRTDTGEYRNVVFSNVDAMLQFDAYKRRQPGMLRWYLSQVRVDGGTVDLNGTFFNRRLHINSEVLNVEIRPVIESMTGQARPGGMFSGNLSGRVDVTIALGGDEHPLLMWGEGTARIDESRFVANRIFNALGGLLRLPIFEDIVFSRIQGPFQLVERSITSEGIHMQNPVVDMRVSGAVTLDGNLDLQLRALFLQFARDVPLIGGALDIFNRLVGQVISVRVGGTLSDPTLVPITPLDTALELPGRINHQINGRNGKNGNQAHNGNRGVNGRR